MADIDLDHIGTHSPKEVTLHARQLKRLYIIWTIRGMRIKTLPKPVQHLDNIRYKHCASFHSFVVKQIVLFLLLVINESFQSFREQCFLVVDAVSTLHVLLQQGIGLVDACFIVARECKESRNGG